MGHRTLAFESTEDRMSVAFDILPIGLMITYWEVLNDDWISSIHHHTKLI